MKSTIENRVDPLRKILEGGWELADRTGEYDIFNPVLDYARQSLNQFEDWFISTAPSNPRKPARSHVENPETLTTLFK